MAKKQNDTNIWDVKYRPKTFEEYINSNPVIVEKFKEFILTQDPPSILLYGPAGSGKSLIAGLLVEQLNCELLEVNGSDSRGIDFIRETVIGFCKTGSFKKLKIVWVEESDRLTPHAQDILRDVMMRYQAQCRFIFTANYFENFTEAMKSRFAQGTFKVSAPKQKEIFARCKYILETEGIVYEIEDVAQVIKKMYPDIRATLGTLQLNVIDKQLKLTANSFESLNYLQDIVTILVNKEVKKNDAYVQIRALVNKAAINDYNPVFSFLYKSVPTLTTEIATQANIDLIIADTQRDVAMVVDKEIGFMSGLIKLISELK